MVVQRIGWVSFTLQDFRKQESQSKWKLFVTPIPPKFFILAICEFAKLNVRRFLASMLMGPRTFRTAGKSVKFKTN